MKLIRPIIGFIMILSAICLVLWIRWGHIDMTEMRLLLTCWKEYILAVALAIGGWCLARL